MSEDFIFTMSEVDKVSFEKDAFILKLKSLKNEKT